MDTLAKRALLEEILAQDSVEIQIRGGATLISTEDLLRVLSVRNKWFINPRGYVVRSVTTAKGISDHERLHTFITGFDYVDHINGNPLDNRRENLRKATHRQNTWNQSLASDNTSGYKGAVPLPSGRFIAQIGKDRKLYRLGTYDTVEEAAMAYDDAAVEMFGEFAALNFPREGYRCIHDAA